MGNRNMGCQLMGLFLLILVLESSASHTDKRHGWRKTLLPEESTSSFVINKVEHSSIVLRLHGNVYPTGFYNATLSIGQPPKPYFVDVDTGSDLTWLQCDAPCSNCLEAPHPLYKPSNDLVACRDPICASLQPPGEHKCENPEQCDYEVEYADGGSSLGVLVRDAFLLNYTNGMPLTTRLVLGCGYDQILGQSSYYHPIDGVLGLGRGKSSIITQLSEMGLVRNILGHCLSSRGGGFLFFGDGSYDPSRVSWTPLSTEKHYSPGLAELSFGGKATGLRNLHVTFDSGSSYTYLHAQAYQLLTSLVEKELSGKSIREAPDDKTLPICWQGRKPFKSVRDVKKYFKPWALSFNNRGTVKTQFEFLPEDYLIISSKGNACLGILNGTEVGLRSLNVIGDISMQDKMVIYDNEKQLIGWVPSNCDKLPKSNYKGYVY